jgi:diacylglycerol kinase (ATP)
VSNARTAVLIHNPAARQAPSRARLDGAIAPLSSTGWTVEVRTASGWAETVETARLASAEGVDAVLACGGDGTLNGVLRGVLAARREGAPDGTRPAVGIVPSGTGNVWAREAGVPLRVEEAVHLLETGERRRADLGIARIGEGTAQPFLLMCGMGIDARVVGDVEQHPRRKRRFGRAAFVPAALGAITSARPIETRIEVDGAEEVRAIYEAIAGNTRLYGGVARLADAALLDDGQLDLVTFEGDRGFAGRLRSLRLVLRAMRGGLARAQVPDVAYRRGARIVLTPTEELPVQADGEYLGVAGPGAPLTLTVEPQAVTLIVGAGADVLFGRA